MTSVGRAIVLATLLCCLPLAAVGSGVVAADPAPTDSGGDSIALAQDTSSENETVRHRNPAEYDADDTGELERWFSDQLSDRLAESASELGADEYDRAREFLGEEYAEQLEQFASLSDDEDDRTAAFEAAQEEQATLADVVEEYDATLAAYETARADGDDQRARDLAVDLEQLAMETNETTESVRERFEEISTEYDVDLSEPEAAVAQTNERVQSDQADVRDQEFDQTDVTIEAPSEPISYTDPLVANGEVQTADGSPVANETIRLEIGAQELEAQTDANGAFTFEYRPVAVPADADSITVRYEPEPETLQFPSDTEVPVTIEQVEPTLSVSTDTDEPLAYGDPIEVSSTLGVDGTAVDEDVALDGSIAGVSVGTVVPGADAEAANATVPADVPAGEQDLTVESAADDRALGPATAVTSIEIAETEPVLAVGAERVGDDAIAVDGTLTADDEGIAGADIQLQADGETIETVTTDADGSFSATVTLPADVAAGDVDFVAVHDDDASNLAYTEAEMEVAFPGGDSVLPTWAMAAIGGLLIAVAGAGVWYWRRGSSTDRLPDSDTDTGGSAISSRPDSPGTETPVDAVDPADPESPAPTAAIVEPALSRADTQLEAGEYDAAVENGYVAVRGALEPTVGETPALTHWEFYRTATETVDDRDTLLAVTEGYERAAFGRDDIGPTEAERHLEQAQTLCARADSGAIQADSASD